MSFVSADSGEPSARHSSRSKRYGAFSKAICPGASWRSGSGSISSARHERSHRKSPTSIFVRVRFALKWYDAQ